jgi:uncharacterized protein
MAGETNLRVLIQTMQPVLLEAAYVFCSMGQETYHRLTLQPMGTFREQEGMTVIVSEEQARQAGLPCDQLWACISLRVHSSLSAVGFLAAITTRLAQAGISVNAVSAYYHDHLFVPWDKRETAMDVLGEMSQARNQERSGG